jgi:MFS family permease
MLIGFAQNLMQVFTFRALQGLGYGGEGAIGAASTLDSSWEPT